MVVYYFWTIDVNYLIHATFETDSCFEERWGLAHTYWDIYKKKDDFLRHFSLMAFSATKRCPEWRFWKRHTHVLSFSCGGTKGRFPNTIMSYIKMASPGWVTTQPFNHAFNVQKFTRSRFLHRGGQIFDLSSWKFDLDFCVQIFTQLGA